MKVTLSLDPAVADRARNDVAAGRAGSLSAWLNDAARKRVTLSAYGDWVSTTLALDDDLETTAQQLTGTTEKAALVRQALVALIERESSRRLALLGGSEPSAAAPARRC